MDAKVTPTKNRQSKIIWVLATAIVIALAAVIIRVMMDKPSKKRSQEPIAPYPYHSEDVSFPNVEANITLAGTLTLPAKEGIYPAVILISGSGPQNRNGEVFGHKPFLVISDYLTKNGIAVLRYDDRGFGQSTGKFKEGTSLDFAKDVESAIHYLKTRSEIDKSKIGLVGHSDGGMIAPMVAATSSDVNAIVLLAGPGIQGTKLLLMRHEALASAMGMSEVEKLESKRNYEKIFEIISSIQDPPKLKTELTEYLMENSRNFPSHILPPGMTKEEFIVAQIEEITSPWFLYFLNYDPALTLEKVRCPVLALNGEKDVQVPSYENLTAINEALKRGGNENVTIKAFPGLNHFFQECKTCSLSEYATLDQTFSPTALMEISNWILSQ